jgi:phage terminase small subunit
MSDVPDPPSHLASAGADFFREITGEWELEPHGLAILTQACACLDRVAHARNQIRREGITIDGKNGKVAHPALSVERQSMRVFSQLIGQLKLEDEEPAPARTPTRVTRSPRPEKGGRPPARGNFTPGQRRAP